MFEGIQKSLSEALRRLTGRGRLTEDNIREGLAEVRRALLEADVNYNVANAFIQRVTERAVGQEVLKSLRPSEQIVKIVYDELVNLMGPVDHGIRFAKDRPTVIMLCGLQGSGKTTTAAKLALTLKEIGRKPMLVAADLQRPAAVEQLKVLGEQIQVPVHAETGATPLKVCTNAVREAARQGRDTVILDTAGRLHIAEMPMGELKEIDRVVKPDYVFLVCDAMTGQDAVNSSKAFNEALELNGVILTKLDGDARGGAALSIKEVTKVPIKWIGVGEKLDRLEEFHPERMAQRILGQGDLMGLVERVIRVQQSVDQEKLKKQQERLSKGDFTLEDFREQFATLRQMGVKQIVSMMPGMDGMLSETDEDPEQAFRRFQGMIDSMTPEERRNPAILDLSRRRRIAAGSGTQPHEVKKFVEQFEVVRTLMRQMMNMSMWERVKMVTGLNKMGAFLPGSKLLQKPKIGTGHRKSAKERAEERKKKRKKKR
ncbi:MAG: signal recognition particle protein [Gemmatales bacterium]|nr:signal recognition particle protein [Gemmatales bacterium]MDW8388146.1 signal recognition particle protein [Gemmatales bacterium]